jgi:hypothetical protein
MSESKNDIAWDKIFNKHNILREISDYDIIPISSNQINEFREARLMTKFDHRSQLPKLFIDNELSILPVSRGGYLIGRFEAFHEFDHNDVEIARVDFPTYLESLDYRNITSEATAINCAFVTKILHDFTGEDILSPTVSGRMSSLFFEFKINSKKEQLNIQVGNAQVEIDGGYEGEHSLCLIEAKNYISDDFLVRQLYYPYKLWSNKISKQVRPLFLTYTNGLFHLREYTFDDIDHYNSLRLIKQKKYIVYDGAINIETIQRIIAEAPTLSEPDIPFPQADSFERVVNLCELIKQRDFLTKEEITENYDFAGRQTDYYINAGKYLGLLISRIEDRQNVCLLTKSGHQLFSLSIVDRQIEFVKLILSHSVFKKALMMYFEFGNIPNKGEIVELMKGSNLFHIDSDVTYFRRASTISGWINWILAQIEE